MDELILFDKSIDWNLLHHWTDLCDHGAFVNYINFHQKEFGAIHGNNSLAMIFTVLLFSAFEFLYPILDF